MYIIYAYHKPIPERRTAQGKFEFFKFKFLMYIYIILLIVLTK